MEYGEEDESFTRFLQNLDSGLEIGENLESEPPSLHGVLVQALAMVGSLLLKELRLKLLYLM